MKQHIELKQLMEISEKHQRKLQEWCEARGYFPLLSIGQMIEYLDEQIRRPSKNYAAHFQVFIHREGEKPYGWTVSWERFYEVEENHRHSELCDTLWEAVKSTLDK